MGADLTPGVIHRLAERSEVVRINYNPKVDVFLERPAAGGQGPAAPSGGAGGGSVAEIECGVDLMHSKQEILLLIPQQEKENGLVEFCKCMPTAAKRFPRFEQEI